MHNPTPLQAVCAPNQHPDGAENEKSGDMKKAAGVRISSFFFFFFFTAC